MCKFRFKLSKWIIMHPPCFRKQDPQSRDRGLPGAVLPQGWSIYLLKANRCCNVSVLVMINYWGQRLHFIIYSWPKRNNLKILELSLDSWKYENKKKTSFVGAFWKKSLWRSTSSFPVGHLAQEFGLRVGRFSVHGCWQTDRRENERDSTRAKDVFVLGDSVSWMSQEDGNNSLFEVLNSHVQSPAKKTAVTQDKSAVF